MFAKLLLFAAAVVAVSANALVVEESDHMRVVSSHLTAFAGKEGDVIRSRVAKVGGMSCPECTMITGILINLTATPAGQNSTKKVIDGYCATTFATDATKRDLCYIIGDVIVMGLPKLVKGLEFFGWDIPLNMCTVLFKVCVQPCCATPYTPEQLLLTLPNSTDLSQMMITWVTLEPAPNARVEFQVAGGALQQAAASFSTYTEGGWVGTINRAVMTNLPAGTAVTYRVGSNAIMSDNITFNTLPANIGTAERPLRMLNVADMGWSSNSDFTIASLTNHVNMGDVDMMVHHGDVGYADGEMGHWDVFIRRIQPISSRIPYLTTPGNHELWFNFSSYRHRLDASMPQDANLLSGSMFYSLTVGPVQMLFLNTETWINTAEISKPQAAWINQQLASRTVPLSLVFQHRPLYCNKEDAGNCILMASILQEEVEDIFISHNVDLVVAGHQHYYLRSYPTAHGNATGTSYDSPSSPVYIINGAAGNREGTTRNHHPSEDLYAKATLERGYGIISIVSDAFTNSSLLQYNYYISANGTLFDQINITKRV